MKEIQNLTLVKSKENTYLFYLPLFSVELRLSRHLCPSLLLEAVKFSTTQRICSNLEITAAFFMSGGISFRITLRSWKTTVITYQSKLSSLGEV